MKKNKMLLLVFVLSLFLTSCSLPRGAGYDGIISGLSRPENESQLIKGSFKVKKSKPIEDLTDEVKDKYKNPPNFYIEEDFIKYGDSYSTNPSFKSRYLNYKNILDINSIEADKDLANIKGPVLTVSDGQFFYQNIFVLSENEIAFISDGILFYYEKFDDRVPASIKDASSADMGEEEDNNKNEANEDQNMVSFIGIKRPSEDTNGNQYYKYLTIMLSRKKGQEDINISACNDLFLAWKNNNYITGFEHRVKEDKSEDILFIRPSGDKENYKYYNIANGNANSILYLGNGYLSVQSRDTNTDFRKYRLYDIDSLGENDSLSVIDIAGDEGLDGFIDDTAKAINNNNIDAEAINLIDIQNIGLTRNKGKWNYISNLSLKNGEELIVSDYYLNLVPKIDISPDGLAISWDDIKTKEPHLIDAYTSPNRDILIVQNPQELFVYGLADGLISEKPQLALKLEESDKIVMTNWIYGSQASKCIDDFNEEEKLPPSYYRLDHVE